jgi:hypothetical protein
MDGNLIKEEYSSDSFSKDGWGDYDDDLDEEEVTNNKINEGIVNQKVDEIEIISPKYKKSYFNTNSYSYNQKFKKYYEYKNHNYRNYKDNNYYYSEKNYKDNNYYYSEKNYKDNNYYEKNYRDNHNSYYEKPYKENKNLYHERNYHNKNKNYYNNNKENNNLVNKNISYKKGNYNYKKEYRDNKEHLKYHIFEEENIKTPFFYNSKKQQIEENKIIEPKKNYILLENVLQLDKINEEILAKKNEQIQIVKEKISKNLEKEYGALNINADLYVPKKKLMMTSENKPNFNLMNHQSQFK